MKKLILFIATLFTTFNFCYSQSQNWSFKGYAPRFRDINASQILPTGRIVAAGGREANDAITAFFYSDDSVRTAWSLQMDQVDAMITDLDFPGPTTGYAVGYAGKVYKTTDAGVNWTALTLTGNAATRNYNAVHFLDVNTGIIVGGNKSNDAIQTILRTSDGGQTWSVITDDLGAWLLDVTFVDATHGYATGNSGKILKTSDAGLTWTTVTVPGNLSSRQFHAVHFFNELDGIVVGGFPSNDAIQTIIKTTDGGLNWSIISDNLGSMLKGIDFIDANKGYAVGNDGVVKYTSDQGATWTNLTITGNDNINLNDVFFLNSSFGVATGVSGKTLIYYDPSLTAPSATIVTPATIVDQNTVTINGEVSSNGNTTTVEFEYGTSLSFGNTIAMTPASVSGSNVAVTLTLGGLLPQNAYYGRIKVTNLIGTSYSQTVQFYDASQTTPSATIVSPVTIVNLNTVKIKGEVTAHGGTTTVEFEYGTTLAFGNTAAMTPSSTIGNNVSVSLMLTGLLPQNIYFGRIKVTNNAGTAYSQTVQFYTNSNSVPNYGFELWDEFNFEFVQDWGIASPVQKVNSYDGSYAVKLKAEDNDTPGVIYYADISEGQGSPQIDPLPYNGRPDTLVFYAKYDIEFHDSALVVMNFYNSGNIISDTVYKIYDNSNGQYVKVKVPINYTSLATPDALTLLFVSTNFFGGNLSTVSEISIDNVHFTSTTSQMVNSDMESWDMVSRHKATSWFSGDDQNFNPKETSLVARTNDAYAGDYALLLRNNASRGEYASVLTGTGWGMPTPQFPVSFRHQTFNGFYKFNRDNNDTLFVMVTMFDHGVQIGNAYQWFIQSESEYTSFSIPINYYSPTAIPDYAYISISIYKNEIGPRSPGNSFAMIDNLSFDGIIEFPLAIKDKLDESFDLNVFPNPCENNLNLRIRTKEGYSEDAEVKIYDLTGKLHIQQNVKTNQSQSLDVTSLPSSQIYMVSINVDGKIIINKFFKQ